MNHAWLNSKDGPGYSAAVDAEMEGTIYMRPDGSIGMSDGDKDMPLGPILRAFAYGAQQVKIKIYSKQIPLSECNTRKVQYP